LVFPDLKIADFPLIRFKGDLAPRRVPDKSSGLIEDLTLFTELTDFLLVGEILT